jgi:hypothetical protein
VTAQVYLALVLSGVITFEFYLQWINYRGRFKYKLLEGNKLWRSVQSKVGVLSLPISAAVKLLLMLFLSVLTSTVFGIPSEWALLSVSSGYLGFTVANAAFDKISVEAFEKFCIKCEHSIECDAFLEENCQMKYLKHRVKMASSLHADKRVDEKSAR